MLTRGHVCVGRGHGGFPRRARGDRVPPSAALQGGAAGAARPEHTREDRGHVQRREARGLTEVNVPEKVTIFVSGVRESESNPESGVAAAVLLKMLGMAVHVYMPSQNLPSRKV